MTQEYSTEFSGCIGIDLGTTYSCLGIWQEDRVQIVTNDLGNRTTPSWVAFTPNERLLGEAAKNQASMNPNNTLFDVKRLIGRRFSDSGLQEDLERFPYTVLPDQNDLPLIQVEYKGQIRKLKPEEVSAMVLQKMKSTAEAYLGQRVRRAVVTVPAYFNDYQRQATKDAVAIAGMECLRIINEPTAACLCYGLDKQHAGANILIYDCGGGTTDVSVLSLTSGIFEVIATSGNSRLGGEDFDHLIMEWVIQEFRKKCPIPTTTSFALEEDSDSEVEGDPIWRNGKSMRKLKVAVEKAKCTLSIQTQTVIEIDSLWQGEDLQLRLSRSKFEEIAAPVFKRCMEPVRQVLRDAEMEPKQIDEIVLIGGSTRIPKIQELLSTYFKRGSTPRVLNHSVNPDEAVAYGAAIQGAILTNSDQSGKTKELVLIDVLPLSLGLETSGGIMTKLIERNQTVPISNSQVFSTVEDSQASVLIQVFEGERKFTKNNNLLGTFELTDIPSLPRGTPKIEVTFDIDANGIMNVTAVEQSTGQSAQVQINRESGRLSQEEIQAMIEEAEVYKAEDELRKASLDYANSFEKYLYSVQTSINNSELNPNLTEEELSWANQYIINTFSWLSQNWESSKEILEQARQQVEYNLKPYLYKVYSRQVEIQNAQTEMEQGPTEADPKQNEPRSVAETVSQNNQQESPEKGTPRATSTEAVQQMIDGLFSDSSNSSDNPATQTSTPSTQTSTSSAQSSTSQDQSSIIPDMMQHSSISKPGTKQHMHVFKKTVRRQNLPSQQKCKVVKRKIPI